MEKGTVKKWLRDPYVFISVIVGVVLMVMTFYYRVNPVEGSVVRCGKALAIVLLITTMPAWITGGFIAQVMFGHSVHLAWIGWIIYYGMIYAIQIAIYFLLGLLLRLIHNKVFGKQL